MRCKTIAGMAKQSDKRDHQLTVRIPQYLRDELDREAERERRSVADIVVFILEDRYGKRSTKAKGGK